MVLKKTKGNSDFINDSFLMQKYPGKGGWTFVEIPKPKELLNKKIPFGWVKVKGHIDTFELQGYRLMPMANGNLFLPIKSEIRKKIKKQAGDFVQIVLEPDNDPLEIPEEFLLCLMDDVIAHNTFLACTESQQKLFLDWIYSAKKDETRIDRIAKSLNKLAQGKKFMDQ